MKNQPDTHPVCECGDWQDQHKDGMVHHLLDPQRVTRVNEHQA